MIIGFGFGSPLISLIMLIITSVLSYAIYKMIKGNPNRNEHFEDERQLRRRYYYEQRERAHAMMREFDLSDEEIERRVEQEI